MGSLTLPPAGPVYLDANGFMYSIERIEPYRTLFLTNDGGFCRVPGLPVAVLHEVVKQAP